MTQNGWCVRKQKSDTEPENITAKEHVIVFADWFVMYDDDMDGENDTKDKNQELIKKKQYTYLRHTVSECTELPRNAPRNWIQEILIKYLDSQEWK